MRFVNQPRSSRISPALRSNRVSRGFLLALALAALLGPAGPHGASGAAVEATARQERPVDLVITGATIIDGISDLPLAAATIVVRDGKIESVRQGGGDFGQEARVIHLEGGFLLPGLIDAHVHIASFEAARTALMTGVTTARSMGTSNFADVGLRELAARGHIEAPEILAAGYHVRPRPAPALFLNAPALGDLMDPGVHGPDAMRRMARAMIENKVDFIKTNATERAGLPDTDPRNAFYNEEELRALVEEAAAAGIPVATHAHGDGGGSAAVHAGVRSIEHGTWLTRETLELMAEKGTFLVPTIAVVRDLAEPGGDYDHPRLIERGKMMLPQIRETAGTAHQLGVTIVTATDTGYGPDSVVRLVNELEEFVGVGLTPMEAIKAATSNAAKLLRIDDRTGRIAPGFEADLIVTRGNPLEEINALGDLVLIVNNGRVVRERER